MNTVNIRVSKETHQQAKLLAEACKISTSAIFQRAIEAYHRQLFFQRVNEDFARLKADPVAWEEEKAERALWDNTLLDGLEDE